MPSLAVSWITIASGFAERGEWFGERCVRMTVVMRAPEFLDYSFPRCPRKLYDFATARNFPSIRY